MLLISHPDCLRHRTPARFPECVERLARIRQRLECRDAAPREWRPAVLAVHDEEYVDRFTRAVERGDGLLDSADNPLSAGTLAAAVGAVAACLEACDGIVSDGHRQAFALVRPPGHHAERGMAMGFCYFNSIAVAAEHLRRRHGIERLAIFDFDVHHGNGTQHIFAADPDVLYASVHQFPFYPGTGAASERGTGAGEGATLNLPLPAGSGDDVYEEAIRGGILPAIEAFRPQILLLSAGFDSWQNDPLGGMRVTLDAFTSWGRWLGDLASRVCDGRVLAVLEGGYDLEALPELVAAHAAALEGGA